ncbi:putative deaminase of polymorphic toxin system [Haloactinospora alba]|uniref:Putative deaminase of polymorphic toxin system n=1 Tax=Haloactinospora alba TaxID=405555 RepID=A0A543NEB0_9ACTN|nr:deaminase domain-containing protein [Haloactinospora alba]TQN30188.1 putative deaminase of polymorphic toxin system [Haloactinospora alba]
MSENETNELLTPEGIPVPEVRPEELEAAAKAIDTDGQNIADSGNSIQSTWQGLAEVYSAPESGELLSAVDAVSKLGEDVNDALETVADALRTFAEEAAPLKKKLASLKSQASEFLEGVEDVEEVRDDDEEREEHNRIKTAIDDAVVAYQAAERKCANKITELFDGTTFVPDKGEILTEGREAHGVEEIPEGAATPWGTSQEEDKIWIADVGWGVWDVTGGATVDRLADMARLSGFYTDEGWGVESASDWWGNVYAYGEQRNKETMALVGLVKVEDSGFGVWGDWERRDGVAEDAWKGMGDSIVPVSEWEQRPGYTITVGGINAAASVVGGAGLARGAASSLRGLRQSLPAASRGDLSLPDRSSFDLSSSSSSPGSSPDGGDRGSLSGDGLDDLRSDALDDAADLEDRYETPSRGTGHETPGSGEAPGQDGSDRGETNRSQQAESPESLSDDSSSQPDGSAERAPVREDVGDTSGREAPSSTQRERDTASAPDREASGTRNTEDSPHRPEEDISARQLQQWTHLADEVGWERAMELAGIERVPDQDMAMAGKGPDASASQSDSETSADSNPGVSYQEQPTRSEPQRTGGGSPTPDVSSDGISSGPSSGNGGSSFGREGGLNHGDGGGSPYTDGTDRGDGSYEHDQSRDAEESGGEEELRQDQIKELSQEIRNGASPPPGSLGVEALRESLDAPELKGTNRIPPKSNTAIMRYDIEGVDSNTLAASSGKKEKDNGLVKSLEEPVFETEEGGNSGRYDSEVKLLEDIDSRISKDSTGTIEMYTERPPCISCQNVVDQFISKYPGIDIKVTWGERNIIAIDSSSDYKDPNIGFYNSDDPYDKKWVIEQLPETARKHDMKIWQKKYGG